MQDTSTTLVGALAVKSKKTLTVVSSLPCLWIAKGKKKKEKKQNYIVVH